MQYLGVEGSRARAKAAALGFLVASLLSGCTDLGAPSLYLAGAYFPAWLLSALVGVIAAAAARATFAINSQARALPYQLLLCSSIGLIAGLVFWLVGFCV